MKRIAFYLPQFHSIPENDEWWGVGFTEWDNVRKSKAQFTGHDQPEKPLNENYYCLLDSRVQERQSELALEYGIDGFCYYHYWFEGKLLLEKPMENMISNKNIKIPFCISWANESWARTWDGEENKVLIKQNYNEDKVAWRKHFEYLLVFFKDTRYIKVDNKPLLLIYKPHLINDCKEMLYYWNSLAVAAGFDGLFVGCQHPASFDRDFREYGINFGVEFEPLYSIAEEKKELKGIKNKFLYGIRNPKWAKWKVMRRVLHYPNVHDYDIVWKRILSRTPKPMMAPGAFPSWDNTPRRGNDSDVYFKAEPKKFSLYFSAREKLAEEKYDISYLFINAWNEWAEGAHLEPDEKNKYGYLEAIKRK